jgi:hypothetical protein
MIELYDLIYSALPNSDAFRTVVAETKTDLPGWVIPLSSVDRSLLERIAEAMELRAGDTFVDLACGLVARHFGSRKRAAHQSSASTFRQSRSHMRARSLPASTSRNERGSTPATQRTPSCPIARPAQ